MSVARMIGGLLRKFSGAGTSGDPYTPHVVVDTDSTVNGGALSVGGSTITVKPTFTVTVTTYATTKVIGGKLTLPIARVAGKGVTLNTIAIASEAAGLKPTGNILIFDADPTASTITDNTVLSIHANDIAKLVGVIPVATADWKTPAVKSIVEIVVNRAYVPASGTNLYAAFVCDNAAVLAATDNMKIAFKAFQD